MTVFATKHQKQLNCQLDQLCQNKKMRTIASTDRKYITVIYLQPRHDYATIAYFMLHNYVAAGYLLRAGTRVIYPAMAVHVPGYRRGRPIFIISRIG